MARTKEQDRERRENAMVSIKAAALKLFLTRGLEGTNIADIAQNAGVSTGLFYHYYDSKEDLYARIVEETVDRANSALHLITDSPLKPADKILVLVREVLNQMRADELAAHLFIFMPRVLLAQNVPEKVTPLLKNVYLPIDILKKIIVAGQETGEILRGDPNTMSTLFFSILTGLCSYKIAMGDKFPFPEETMLTRIFLAERRSESGGEQPA